MPSRPHVVLIAAASLDGKLADAARSPARFGSAADRARLEEQIAAADAALFGAGTLRAYGTTLPVTNTDLLAARQQAGRPPQPVHIVVSRAADFETNLRFFRQPVPRWLLALPAGAARWQGRPEFARAIAIPPAPQQLNSLDWPRALQHLATLGLQRLALLGGGKLIASLLAVDAIDELHLTLCPLILGGGRAPTLCEGAGWPAATAPRWQLLAAEPVGDEVWLHYRRCLTRAREASGLLTQQ